MFATEWSPKEWESLIFTIGFVLFFLILAFKD